MRIIKTVNGAIYINQALKDYVNNIWATFNKEIPNDKNIFFLKNTTIPRIITDYSGKNISRVIKKEKIVNSDLEANLDWILYLYHQRGNDLFDYDNKDIVRNYYRAKNINLNQILSHSVDNSLAIITNQDVKDLFVQYIRAEFNKYVESSFIKNVLHTNMFELVNFELKLK